MTREHYDCEILTSATSHVRFQGIKRGENSSSISFLVGQILRSNVGIKTTQLVEFSGLCRKQRAGDVIRVLGSELQS